jgi:hypothetical protein
MDSEDLKNWIRTDLPDGSIVILQKGPPDLNPPKIKESEGKIELIPLEDAWKTWKDRLADKEIRLFDLKNQRNE